MTLWRFPHRRNFMYTPPHFREDGIPCCMRQRTIAFGTLVTLARTDWWQAMCRCCLRPTRASAAQ